MRFIETDAWEWRQNTQNTTHVFGADAFEDSVESPEQTNSIQRTSGNGHQLNSPVQAQVSSEQASENESTPIASFDGSPPRKMRSLSDIYANSLFALHVADPTTYEEAFKEEVWRFAMDEEIASIKKNRTWDLVEQPTGRKILGLKWVYKTKYQSNGRVLKHKARLVAKGYSQELGIDIEDVYSPVARMETVRIVLAVAAQVGWPVFHFDVKSAFLNGDISEEVFVEQPPGYQEEGKESYVCKLRKALYGLRQAPKAWYSKLDGYLTCQGFNRSNNEHTLYKKHGAGEDVILVCVYVDDIIYLSSSMELIAEFKRDMMKAFEMTDLGLLHYFLGLEVSQHMNCITVRQVKYIQDLLKQCNMKSCKAELTPMATNIKLQIEDGSGLTDARQYRVLIG